MSELEAIRDAARRFREERDWEQFQDPKSVMLALVGEIGELAELLQWLPADRARELVAQEPLHTRVTEELGDVLVYLVGLADQCGVGEGNRPRSGLAVPPGISQWPCVGSGDSLGRIRPGLTTSLCRRLDPFAA